MVRYPKIAQLKDSASFIARLRELGIDRLPFDKGVLTAEQGSPLGNPLIIGQFTVGNRWCIHPMEGWDANGDGSPSPHTLRRWKHFGLSGAKLIWGGEAAAVQSQGRANPRQTIAGEQNRQGLQLLLAELLDAHQKHCGDTSDLLVGLQLTHSGRFSRPNGPKLEPRIAYHHPLLDTKFGISPDDDSVVFTDDELHRLVDRYVEAARVAYEIGYQFVDIKACHGYLLHEFLSAFERKGQFGGDFEGRTRLLATILRRVRDEIPDLILGVRLSIFDLVPYQQGESVGIPVPYDHLLPYRYAFGTSAKDPRIIDLEEPIKLLRLLRDLGVVTVNLSCGSPYYCPHAQRPAIFPPSDGYMPPEDPLLGVWRQIETARQCKQAVPELVMVGTGYSYLQDFLPHVAQAVVREGWIDSVGLGRMVLSYPELPLDALRYGKLRRKKVCRTFSDCTTAPRNGLVSGCYPLDSYYKDLPEYEQLRNAKSDK